MDYFCYISRSKVDQLYHALAPRETDEWTEQESTEHEIGTNASADLSIARIFSIFKGGVSYGRKGVIQRERKIKLEYVEKLQKVLVAAARATPVKELRTALRAGESASLYYHYAGSFTLAEPIRDPTPGTVVTLQAEVEGRKLLLDCSLRFFSEGNEPDGTFAFTSTNARFFAGKIPLQMETVFIMLDRKPDQLIGTPLYLKLDEHAVAAL